MPLDNSTTHQLLSLVHRLQGVGSVSSSVSRNHRSLKAVPWKASKTLSSPLPMVERGHYGVSHSSRRGGGPCPVQKQTEMKPHAALGMCVLGTSPGGLETLAGRFLEATGGGMSTAHHPQLGSCHGTALGLSSRTEKAGSELCFLGRQPVLVALRLPGTESGRAGTGSLSSLQSRLSGHTLLLVPESHKHSASCSRGEKRHRGDSEPHLCPETQSQVSGSRF